MRPPFYKRRYFVSGYQYRLMYGNFLYLIATVFVFFVAIFGPVIATLGDDSLPQEQRDVAASQLLVLNERVWFGVPLIIVLCLAHSVAMSHRIAGPLFRFKQVFEAMGHGDLTMQVRIRRGDYL